MRLPFTASSLIPLLLAAASSCCVKMIAAQDPNCHLQRFKDGVSQYLCEPVFGVPNTPPNPGEDPYLVYMGEPPFDPEDKLEMCQGRCVMDSDCKEGLSCRQRDPYREPVGCQGNHLLRFMNYCLAEEITGELTIESDETAHPLRRCHGACLSNEDCQGGLECWVSENAVPGCTGEQEVSVNYCYDPNDIFTEDGGTEVLVLEYLGEPPYRTPLLECQGDCDSDWNCDFGLNCFKRADDRMVPGCMGAGIFSVDYCYIPDPDHLVIVRDDVKGTGATTAGRCEGSCSTDDDCDSELRCLIRLNYERVPGCLGVGAHATNYCYDPSDEIIYTDSPSAAPIGIPSRTPTSPPTEAPADVASDSLSESPAASPSSKPSTGPSANPVIAPSDVPSTTPVVEPSSIPSFVPTTSPSSGLSAYRSVAPSNSPSKSPTDAPSDVPSKSPTVVPSSSPTDAPSTGPSAYPVASPSGNPTQVPVQAPSSIPIDNPVAEPTEFPINIDGDSTGRGIPTVQPKEETTTLPTTAPTSQPSPKPTKNPIAAPSPTVGPSESPSTNPSKAPVDAPSHVPSPGPFVTSSSSPTLTLSAGPSNSPSEAPVVAASNSPTVAPIAGPSSRPSEKPNASPSASPVTSIPVSEPTDLPINVDGDTNRGIPTAGPKEENSYPTSTPGFENEGMALPTVLPSSIPTAFLSSLPSLSPTFSPVAFPSGSPSYIPSSGPSSNPSNSPSDAPSYNCAKSPIQRAQEIGLKVLSLSGFEAFETAESPQSQAYNWIVNLDAMAVCPDDSTLLERYILAVLSFSLSSDSWSRCSVSNATECEDSLFLSGAGVCEWDGIRCNSSGNVTAIRLDELNLQGRLPLEIGFLEQLMEIDMDSNGLTGPIPSSIGLLESLEILDLDSNDLNGTIPESIYDLSALRVIDLDGNMLSGNVSTEIGRLSQLYFLQLDFNLFVGGVPSEMGTLSSLKYLSLFGNSFTGAIPSDLCNGNGINRTIYANCDVCADASCCTACLSL